MVGISAYLFLSPSLSVCAWHFFLLCILYATYGGEATAAENRILVVRIMNSFGVERPSATNQTITSYHVVKRKLVTISISYPQIHLSFSCDALLNCTITHRDTHWLICDLCNFHCARSFALFDCSQILLDKCFSTIFIVAKE